jgi:hypothetical protein
MSRSTLIWLIIILATFAGKHDGQDRFQPNQDKLPVLPPRGATVLFNGAINQFLSKTGGKVNWPVNQDEIVSTKGKSRSNHIVSRVHFRDAEIHVEFKLPPKGSGNSGIYIHGNYEIQIINSHGKEKIGKGDCGALYGFHRPRVNACRKPDAWQVMDIRYQAPRRSREGKISMQGEITAWLNGKLVLNQVSFGEPRSTYHPFRYNTTDYLKDIWEKQKKEMVGPVFLQDHDNAVVFRNVWIQALDDKMEIYDAQPQQ